MVYDGSSTDRKGKSNFQKQPEVKMLFQNRICLFTDKRIFFTIKSGK